MCLLALLPAQNALALTSDQIALVVNKNVLDSIHLAQLYSAARHIPNDRTILLDIPFTDEIAFDSYERNVVPPIRQFLRDHGLEHQVTCLVTFWGVPYRIQTHEPTDAERQEVADLNNELTQLFKQVNADIGEEEALAKSLDPRFTAPWQIRGERDGEWMAARHVTAIKVAAQRIDALTDPDLHKRDSKELLSLIVRIGGSAELIRRVDWNALENGPDADGQREKLQQLREHIQESQRLASQLEALRYDADARAALRKIVGRDFGPILLMQSIETQIDYLKPGVTGACLDNELALLWWYSYPRQSFWYNPLNYKLAGRLNIRPTIMVSRLDGPDVPTVEQMIQTSVDVEQTGLKGCFALNSFGWPGQFHSYDSSAYQQFDRQIRDTAEFARDKSNVPVREEYLHFFQHEEVKQTALYCGWYSLGQYVDGMQFAPGAVGYHIASSEMVALHGSGVNEWVNRLLAHGVVATLGPVSEPYLQAFPPPGDFFPLLMTGKLTLAEVYWKTEPYSSWMIGLIGDPLYNPFKADPAVKVEDLPLDLRPAVENQ